MKTAVFSVFFACLLCAQEGDSLADSLNPGKRPAISCDLKPSPGSCTDGWFSQDKFLHFSACASITGLSYHTLVCRMHKDEDTGRIFSVSLTALVGLGKEIFDKKRGGLFSWKDLCWDGLGLAFGYFAFVHEY
jgi:uncharacterized protein YfiM (DUF2279 family)